MNSLERVLACLRFAKVDRIPCIPLVFGHAAWLTGVKLRSYVSDGKVMAQCQLQALQEFGHDAVFAYADNSVEAEAIGARLSYPENTYPVIQTPCLESLKDLDRLVVPDPLNSGRLPQVVEACRILRHRVGERTLVVGIVLGPLSIAGQIMGLEKLLYSLLDDPQGVKAVLDFTAETSIAFGLSMLRAGIHIPLLYDPTASCSVITEKIFVEFEAPLIKRVFSTFKAAGAQACWLQITGRTQPILPYFRDTGADLATVDYLVDLEEAFNLSPELGLLGNLKPYCFVAKQPEEIGQRGRQLVNLAAERGGFILGSGGEVPLEARAENVRALVKAVS